MKSGEAKLFVGILVVALILVGAAAVPTLLRRTSVTKVDVNRDVKLATVAPPGAHMIGNPSAPFTLVEFSDYQ